MSVVVPIAAAIAPKTTGCSAGCSHNHSHTHDHGKNTTITDGSRFANKVATIKAQSQPSTSPPANGCGPGCPHDHNHSHKADEAHTHSHNHKGHICGAGCDHTHKHTHHAEAHICGAGCDHSHKNNIHQEALPLPTADASKPLPNSRDGLLVCGTGWDAAAWNQSGWDGSLHFQPLSHHHPDPSPITELLQPAPKDHGNNGHLAGPTSPNPASNAGKPPIDVPSQPAKITSLANDRPAPVKAGGVSEIFTQLGAKEVNLTVSGPSLMRESAVTLSAKDIMQQFTNPSKLAQSAQKTVSNPPQPAHISAKVGDALLQNIATSSQKALQTLQDTGNAKALTTVLDQAVATQTHQGDSKP